MMNSRRAFLAGSTAAALTTFLAGCSQDLPASPSATVSAEAQPVLDSDRLTAVLERINTGLVAADKDKDADALSGYLTGPAVRVRKAEYAIATAAGDDGLIDVFSTTSQAGAVGLTTAFPRTALTVTQTDATNTVPYLLTLTQESPRDDYELWGWARLFAGVEVPSTTTASVGSEQIDVQSTGLVKTPQEVLEAYIDALNAPDGENGVLFADDPVRQSVAAARATDVAAAGEVSVSASAGTDGFKGLRTTEGGAIVTTTLGYSTVYKKTVAGATFNLGGTVGTLLGSDTEVRGTVTASYDVIIAFSVPSADVGGAPVALGATMVLSSVARDDSQAPA